jgi:DNA-binding CsgD family transcriptional regulator
MQENFSGFGYVVVSQFEAPTAATTNFGDEWHQKYFQEEFHKIDPVFAFNNRCGRSGVKLLTTQDMSSPLFEEAQSFGADSNFISVSVFGGNRLIFGGVNHDLDERAVSSLHRSCQSTHRMMLIERIDGLSDGQIDFMEMCEEGLLDKQIACELGVSISAVAQRKRAICNKVGVTNFRSALSLYSMRKWSGIVPIA